MSQQLQIREKEIGRNVNRAEKSMPTPKWRNLHELLEYVETQAQIRVKNTQKTSI